MCNDMYPPFAASYKIVSLALKILCAPPIHHSLPPNPVSLITPGNRSSFYCFHSFLFPKCHIVGIIQYVAFSDQPLPVSYMEEAGLIRPHTL